MISVTDASSSTGIRTVVDLRGETIVSTSSNYATKVNMYRSAMATTLSIPVASVAIVSTDAISTRRRLFSSHSSEFSGTRVVSEIDTTLLTGGANATTVLASIGSELANGGFTQALENAGLTGVTAVGVRSVKLGSTDRTTVVVGALTTVMVTSSGATTAYSANATAFVESDAELDGLLAQLSGLISAALGLEEDDDNDSIIIIACAAGGGVILFLLIIFFLCCKGKKVSEAGKPVGSVSVADAKPSV